VLCDKAHRSRLSTAQAKEAKAQNNAAPNHVGAAAEAFTMDIVVVVVVVTSVGDFATMPVTVTPTLCKLLVTEDTKVAEELVNVDISEEALTVDPAGMVTV
jgi:hypothetical protein